MKPEAILYVGSLLLLTAYYAVSRGLGQVGADRGCVPLWKRVRGPQMLRLFYLTPRPPLYFMERG
ncbi:MAG: hypothetical protein Kow00120_11090 [Anaerolineae bacterium]